MRAATVRLAGDRRGSAVVEFALVLPVLLLTLMGTLDLAYNVYTAQMLQGAVQNAARLSTIQGADQNQVAIDDSVTKAVQAVAPRATLTFKRTAYASFSSVARPEDFTDVNNDGTCSGGEPYEDMNANSRWDSDSGTSGFGGSRDTVLYTVTITYPRISPFIDSVMKWSGKTNTLTAVTALRNQPYAAQTVRPVKIGNCP